VKRLSQELAARLAAEGSAATHGTLAAARAAAVSGAAGGDADVPLPPWIKDSRCVVHRPEGFVAASSVFACIAPRTPHALCSACCLLWVSVCPWLTG
jgi:hypothetical protein